MYFSTIAEDEKNKQSCHRTPVRRDTQYVTYKKINNTNRLKIVRVSFRYKKNGPFPSSPPKCVRACRIYLQPMQHIQFSGRTSSIYSSLLAWYTANVHWHCIHFGVSVFVCLSSSILSKKTDFWNIIAIHKILPMISTSTKQKNKFSIDQNSVCCVHSNQTK